MEESLEQTVRRLAAIEEIKNLKARYFRCVDYHHWDEFRELFTEDLALDFAETTSHPKNREEFVASVKRHFESSAWSVHHGHAPEITIHDEDHASGIWPMFDTVMMPKNSGYQSHTGYGRYTEEYRREDGRWRISRSELSRVHRVILDHADE